MLHLEECVGEDDGIERGVLQMGPARLLDIAPDRIDSALMVLVRIELQVLKDIFLHVYRVHLPFAPDDRRRRTRVVARARAEVADLHTFAKAELEYVLMRGTEMRAHMSI